MMEINEAWERFYAEILTMKEQLSDVMDATVALDKRIEKLERLVENA